MVSATDRSPHHSQFVSSQGLRLNYLDWGGTGPSMVFLPGLGDSAHTFDTFAPRFVNRYHVLGLSWRGAGLSDTPASGYDVDTMTGDLKGFLDALQIRKVILVGHSMAGAEMTRFAGLYPERVMALVYLDAAYDRTHLAELFQKDPIPHEASKPITPPASALASAKAYIEFLLAQNPQAPGVRGRALWEIERRQNDIILHPDGSVALRQREPVFDQSIKGMSVALPDYTRVQAPALAIYAVADHYAFPMPDNATKQMKAQATAYWQETVLPWVEANIRQFKNGVRHSAVLELRNADHLVYLDRAEEVYVAMSHFLSQTEPKPLALPILDRTESDSYVPTEMHSRA